MCENSLVQSYSKGIQIISKHKSPQIMFQKSFNAMHRSLERFEIFFFFKFTSWALEGYFTSETLGMAFTNGKKIHAWRDSLNFLIIFAPLRSKSNQCKKIRHWALERTFKKKTGPMGHGGHFKKFVKNKHRALEMFFKKSRRIYWKGLQKYLK